MAISEDLPRIPEIPAQLREAAARTTLIPFVGAGLSILGGCPSWNELADKALQFLLQEGKITHQHVDQVRTQSPRVKLSLAKVLAAEHGVTIDFKTLLHPNPPLTHARGCRAYKALFSMSRTFITTNYDLWLDHRIPENEVVVQPQPEAKSASVASMTSIYRPNLFVPKLLSDSDTVVHLHGSVVDPQSMVMTTRDYMNHYSSFERSPHDPDKENRVITFLSELFRTRTVLFVGYGLEELEILEYVIAKASPPSNEVKHFMLQGFFSHQKMLMSSLRAYYLKECGIQLLPFSRDENDYDQLMDVLEAFAAAMPATSALTLQKMTDMEGWLD